MPWAHLAELTPRDRARNDLPQFADGSRFRWRAFCRVRDVQPTPSQVRLRAWPSTANIPWHITRKRGTVDTDRPGREVSQEHREVIVYLIDSQGWAYKRPRGGGYPRLFPADRSQSPIRVPISGHARGHAFSNWIAEIRRKGGHWPPDRK